MNNDKRHQGSKRRHRTSDPKTTRTTGEEARAKPSMSIPGFTEKELTSMADKLRMLGMVMDDWSPIANKKRDEPGENNDGKDNGV